MGFLAASTCPDMHRNHDAEILQSWHRNAEAWTRAVRDALIESRRQATDAAIIEAVVDTKPRTVLDVGCGEGWLVRALAAHGIQATGIDAVPALVERAREAGGNFQVAAYEELAGGLLAQRVNTVVCNFSLLGAASVERLLMTLPSLLDDDGRLLVQTVHPLVACGEHVYADGWRVEPWTGFAVDFPAPAPWYFRTLGSWIALFAATGWHLREMREPLHPQTGRPASVIFVARR
jgi:2-polyprenyl-3-methyl-5-hydroxy-6-metoxy-1,4-benzoquinol methylase